MKDDKPFLEKMYQGYGFKVAMSNFIGKYAIGSGASWSQGTDYENPEHQKNMMNYVRQMVMEFKDEPYILMWILGNENNYGVASNADKKPEAYFKFINEVARMIKSIDPNHPVAVCNGDTLFLDKFGKYAPDVDAYGANVYRGNYGFGSFWDEVKELADRPAFITEYGAPSYGGVSMNYEQAQQAQSDYHKGNWLDILYNSAGYEEGAGNSVGGMAFEWLDEWWKDYSPSVHDTKADAVGPFPGGYYFEEWFGILGQGDGSQSPYLREPRKVYYTYRELWKD
jgi:beta-glucuronidase